MPDALDRLEERVERNPYPRASASFARGGAHEAQATPNRQGSLRGGRGACRAWTNTKRASCAGRRGGSGAHRGSIPGPNRVPGRAAVHAGRPRDDVPRSPLDHAAVRRVRDREGDEPAGQIFPVPGQRKLERRGRPPRPQGGRQRRAPGAPRATAVQEIGFTLANGIEYMEAAVRRGLDVDAIAPQISFFFNAHIDLLEEVAKFRAARRLWASIMAERFHAKKAESLALRFHAQTAGVALTAQQPENTAVRVAIQPLAAVIGGAQALHTTAMDQALSLPSERAVRLSLRTQQLLAHESGVANTVDPAGGSYVIESLTDQLEAEAAALIRDVDRRGGMRKGIESGWVQRQIADSSYRFQMELEKGERTIVGVNAYAEGDANVPVQRPDPKLEAEQVRRLKAFRASRDAKAVDRSLRRLEAASQTNANLVPEILSAVKASATLGEISGGLPGALR